MSPTGSPEFRAEMDLASDMKHYGTRIFDGSTDMRERMKRARAAIITGNLARRIIERTHLTRPENFAEAFERVYGEPLVAKRPSNQKELV